MAFGSFGSKGNTTPMAEINMVPLIDVMLVLLVIFIITAPLLSHSVKINLPQAASQAMDPVADKIDFAVNQDGQMFWNGEPVDMATATVRLQDAGRKTPTPELHIRADRETRYRILAEVMAEAARAGVTKIGFVSDPKAAEVQAVTPAPAP